MPNLYKITLKVNGFNKVVEVVSNTDDFSVNEKRATRGLGSKDKYVHVKTEFIKTLGIFSQNKDQ